MRVKGALFDFDGTLTRPGSLDFDRIREAVGCPPGSTILEYIDRMPSARQRRQALETLDACEVEAAGLSTPNAGAEELLEFLLSRGIKTGIITRNSRRSIEISLANFRRIRSRDFSVMLTRDDPYPPKPSPEGVLAAARSMGVAPDELLVVGDYVFDVDAGARAGAQTVFLTNRGPLLPCESVPDYVIDELSELTGILALDDPLPMGKLPNALLGRFLKEAGAGDPSLLLNPGIGEDVAAIGLGDGADALVLKSDPVTFTSQDLGAYVVTVNSNDVATVGATPRWLLSTVLVPPGTPAAQVRRIMRQIGAVARDAGIILCGGHTEVTDAVTRPVVSGTIVGTVERRRIVRKRRMSEGDAILLTKALAVEGTCILARDLGTDLRQRGVPEQAIARASRFLSEPGISVLAEAAVAAGFPQVTAMHDVTEGGLATALEELAAAGGHRVKVDLEQVPVLDECRAICQALGLDPLGLIGSGSLLITCGAGFADGISGAIADRGIPATRIGTVEGPGAGVRAVRRGAPADWPTFEVDELARLYRLRKATNGNAGREQGPMPIRT